MLASIRRVLACLSALACAANLSAVTIIDDTFADGEHTNTTVTSTSSFWQSINGTGTLVSGPVSEGQGSVTVTATDSNGTGAFTAGGYFTPSGTPVSLAVGETITMSLTFSFSGLPSTPLQWRTALLDSKGTRASSPAADDTGHGLWIQFGTGASSAGEFAFFRRTTLGAANIFSTGANWTAIGASGGTYQPLVNGSLYTLTYSIFRQSTTETVLTASMSGDGISTPSTHTATETLNATILNQNVTYDGYLFRLPNPQSGVITIKRIKVDVTSSEPVTTPVITTHPTAQTVTAPAPVALSVTATGATSYQWKKDDVDVSGATAATLTIDPSATSDSGNYTVVVTNSAGSVTSNAAAVTVNAAATAPTITTDPVSQTVTAGASASFTVVATGSAPLSYQWQKDTGSGFGDIAGATTDTLTLANTTVGDTGSYRVVVTNSVNSATSASALLTVNAAVVVAPAIATHPTDLTVGAGASASFTVAATGTDPLSYQWKKDNADISGANSATYTIAATATGDAGSYSVVVTNSAGTATSNAATLTVGAAVVTGTLKVDINRDSNNTAIVTEAGYVKWSETSADGSSSGLNAITKTFTTSTGGTVTVSFSQTAASQTNGGTGLLTNWYKAGAEGTAKLVSDGLSVAPANLSTGGQLQMTLTGLSAGNHTLTTYHNAWDNIAAGGLGPIGISVNGTTAVASLQPTVRAVDTASTASAFLQFAVSGPSEVVTIVFAADPAAPAPVTVRNAMINGFELNTSNTTRIAVNPSPADTDEHVDADSGSVTLSWSAATSGNSLSRDVYFGTSLSAVTAATRTSPEFKGNQTALTWQATGLDSHLTYYWRIDEIDSSGTTKGVVWYFRPRHLAFPGAEGYGRFARGGRGGKVVHVTSLADYTSMQTPVPGTLRYAIEQETGPRTIVFDVSGLITLESRLTINSSYVTLAGQTAPGKGITLRKYTLGLSGAQDVIVRHIRSRPGNISGTTIDGMGMQGSSHCIIDHCSISWSLDEAFSSRSARNITLQRTLISEALNAAGHQNYPVGTEHGYAASIGGDIGSFHHNLLAHNYGRNWSLAGGLDATATFAGRLDITNNVVYNWGSRTTDGGAMEVNFVNNYYKPGAGTTHVPYALTMDHEDNFAGSQRAYFAGNVMPGHFDETNQTAGRRSIVRSGVPPLTYETFVDAPFFESYVATQSAADAYKRVLSDVGANRPLLDDHDARIIRETLDGTFTYRGSVTNKAGFPDSQADVGGWENYPELTRAADWDSDGDGMPDWWETIKGLNKNSTPGDFSEANADPDNDGYTQLEDYLNWIASPNAQVARNASVEIDLSQLTRGYTASPVHAVSTPQNGTVTLGSDGKTATFTPTANFTGLASFDFTVTDSASSSMTGTINLHVLSTELPPTITTQPASQTVTVGASVTLTVVATGNPTYQWKKNGLALTGATNASLEIASAQTSDSGSYTVDVANSAATITSDAALLTVNDALPSITAQPSAQSVAVGAAASFSVTATGGTLTYQWQKDTIDIAGATSSTYSIPATQLSHAGQYRVIVSNSAGPVTSNAAALTLTSPAFAAPTPNGFAGSATGGGNAPPVLVTTAAAFKTQAEADAAAVITVGGTIDLNTLTGGPLVSVRSNKTIQGIDASATIVGRLEIGTGVSNIVIRGLNLTNTATTNGTPLAIAGGSNVFVQNCTFFDAADHLATVTAGADNVTFAWNEFYFSSSTLTPRRGLLIGADTGETKPLHVTLAHNHWSDLIDQRMPRTTYGHVHQYSNYAKPAAATPNTTATAVLANAQLLSERNVYENIVAPLTKSSGGLIRAIDNTYTATTGTAADAGTDTVFVPSYSYTTSKNTDLATAMTTYAGNTAGAASTTPTATTASITGPAAAVANGASFTLNAVSTISSAITYQWRLNNAPITGATSASYAVTSAQTSQSGNYTVTLTLTNGSTIVSTPFALTVNAASGGGGTTPPPPSGGGGGGSPSLGFLAALALLTVLRRRFRR